MLPKYSQSRILVELTECVMRGAGCVGVLCKALLGLQSARPLLAKSLLILEQCDELFALLTYVHALIFIIFHVLEICGWKKDLIVTTKPSSVKYGQTQTCQTECDLIQLSQFSD